MNRIKSNIDTVKNRIAQAAKRCGRSPGEIGLVAVGKTQPIDIIADAISAGAMIIGENYIQEARTKIDALAHLSVQWHCIGHLQRNKAKYAVRMFDLIHSVDSTRLMEALDKRAAAIAKVQKILIQVNISGENTKSGVETESAVDLARSAMQFKHLRLTGLMTMPPFFNAPERARPFFSSLRTLRDTLVQSLGIELPHLSMGMTGDFEVAVEEGATLVRVGTAIFGERQ